MPRSLGDTPLGPRLTARFVGESKVIDMHSMVPAVRGVGYVLRT